MLPVVYETGGPPSSRRRRRATAVPLVLAALTVSGKAKINARNTGAGGISRVTSTATMMTMALTVFLVLVPAAFPEKIPIEMTASLFCSYANEEKPGKSSKRRGRLWHEKRRHGGVGVGVAERVRCLVQIMSHARVVFLLVLLCRTSKPLRGVYFWWNYAKGIVKISENAHPLAVSWYMVEDTGVRCLCEGRQGHLPLKQTRRSPNAINSTVLSDKGDRTMCP
ncbi:hypothetical protein G5I_09534 [Acromyrmex echinatior]|uniref:Uncharacterized protein n=1 Tax=Acromyrmex echinatior TaxID=103372 RepID=F4WUG4_ACREC|nr:hypothetical protein G5I_09534 [Acromyrmex echinatior]